MTLHFTFISSGMGEIHFSVYDRETALERRIRVRDDVARFVGDTIPQPVLDGLNAWRLAKYESDLAEIQRRYGVGELANIAPFVAFTSEESI